MTRQECSWREIVRSALAALFVLLLPGPFSPDSRSGAALWAQTAAIPAEDTVFFADSDGTGAATDLLLDITYDRDERRPLVVFVHGGSWKRGTRLTGRQLTRTLFQAGFAVASVDYRLWPQVGVRDSALDVASAVRFLHANAARFNLDAHRIALLGYSAGAHLAALALTDPDATARMGPALEAVKAVILLDGHGLDVASYVSASPMLAEVFGATPSERLAASPVNLLNRAAPARLPGFAVLWDTERARTDTQSRALIAAATAAGAAVTALPYPGKPHRAFLTDLNDPGSALSLDVLHFLNRTIGPG